MWSSALALTLKSIVVNGGSLTSVYDDAGYLVRIGQVGSGMEVLHSIFGFVPSPVLTALMQWAGRTHVLMSVVHAIPALPAATASHRSRLTSARPPARTRRDPALGAGPP